MRHLSAALVTVALCAASFAGDLGWIGEHDAHRWDVIAGWALVAFLLLQILEQYDHKDNA